MLLRGGSSGLRRYPFMIILKARTDGNLQPIELKADPGSKVTGSRTCLRLRKARQDGCLAMDLRTEGKRLKMPLISRSWYPKEAGVIAAADTILQVRYRTRPEGWLARLLCLGLQCHDVGA